MSEPIIVVGPPRSGSSSIAKIVQDCGVFIGDEFKDLDNNPEGTYEDRDFNDLAVSFIKGVINTKVFEKGLKRLFDKRNKKYKLWGLKDPHLYKVIGYYLAISSPRFIRINRVSHKCIESMIKTFGWDLNRAYRTYNAINYILDVKLEDQEVLNLNIDEINTGMAKKKITKFING